MRRVLLSAWLLLLAGAFIVFAGGASNGGGNVQGTYKIELDNAFGLVQGADFKIAGVKAGSIKDITLNPKDLKAVVTVQVTVGGFGQFHKDAFCQTRPQSLIGEYYVECQPGSSGPVLKPGSTIPVTQTQSTIPADLLQDVMQMPYRERFTLIINELGAGLAGRPQDLEAALRRAVPALTQTDNLLNLLANDSRTLQALTADSDSVITALANNSAGVQRFIVEANNAATDTATQQANVQSTFAQLPGFLEQLKPAMQKLGTAVDANEPVLQNLNAASGELDRFFTDLPPFSTSAVPALKSLGQASVTGKSAVQAAGPTIADLNRFARPTPELSHNLAIVLHDLDDRSLAVEKDSRSPGGQGYTGLEALLQYVFNITLAVNTYGPFGHQLAVDAFIDPLCSPYATPQTVAANIKQYGNTYRRCYSWLGPNQQGVTTPDPTDGGRCADPGGKALGQRGLPGVSCAPEPAPDAASGQSTANTPTTEATGATGAYTASARKGGTGPPAAANSRSAGGGGSAQKSGPPINLKKTLSQLLGAIGAGGSGSSSTSGGQASEQSQSSSSNGSAQTQQLLNYLLAP